VSSDEYAPAESTTESAGDDEAAPLADDSRLALVTVNPSEFSIPFAQSKTSAEGLLAGIEVPSG